MLLDRSETSLVPLILIEWHHLEHFFILINTSNSIMKVKIAFVHNPKHDIFILHFLLFSIGSPLEQRSIAIQVRILDSLNPIAMVMLCCVP